MMTPAQCRAARALLDWNQSNLGEVAGMKRDYISKFESSAAGNVPTHYVARMRQALESAGVTFLGRVGVKTDTPREV